MLEILCLILAVFILAKGAYRHVLSDRRLYPYHWTEGTGSRRIAAIPEQEALDESWDAEPAQGESR